MRTFFLLYAAFADTTSIILISMLISNRYVEQYMNTFDIFKEIYVRCALDKIISINSFTR